jgi:hypothetical protein
MRPAYPHRKFWTFGLPYVLFMFYADFACKSTPRRIGQAALIQSFTPIAGPDILFQ